ncbi:hypothetical protein BOC36_23995 [Burkholderia pseudomallei]|nr:hypothetical protein BOC36_23995 [Burkholderia pseudomallei]
MNGLPVLGGLDCEPGQMGSGVSLAGFSTANVACGDKIISRSAGPSMTPVILRSLDLARKLTDLSPKL